MAAAKFPPGWRVVTAEAAGPLHLAGGGENQDAHAYRRLGDGFVLAVADGAGSAAWSACGARTAVAAACRVAEDLAGAPPRERSGWWDLRRRYVSRFLHTFDAWVAGLGRPPADLATTVLAVVAHPPAFLFVAVGDCFAVVEHAGGGTHLLVPPDTGPDDGAAVFLTSPGRAASLRAELLFDPAVTGLALCTDGLVEPALAAGRGPAGGRVLRAPQDFGRYFSAFAGPEHSPAMLTDRMHSPEFAAASADDKTMVLAVRA
ncbi:PP2C family serine/threonine-protein phosphatase [Dactylosporangium salmoneum]|uniref:PPM-type phosphatase domain-containing protein n=1 Tax=Dactylosporangium salmoneum TaxID=53361 RepID=A0ABP5T9C4_9ACTN